LTADAPQATEPARPPKPGRGDESPRYLPLHFRALVWVATTLGAVIFWCWFRTVRVQVIHAERERRLREQGAVLYATWHRGIFLSAWYWRWQRGWFLTSSSKDGAWASGLINRLGNRVVRGSSSRGGRKALLELVGLLREGVSGGLTPDAPRGPRRECKAGILAAAQRAGVPIVPVSFACKPCLRMRSWDRTILPLPFARLVVLIGEPLYLERRLDKRSFADKRLLLEEAMNRDADEVDAYVGMD